MVIGSEAASAGPASIQGLRRQLGLPWSSGSGIPRWSSQSGDIDRAARDTTRASPDRARAGVDVVAPCSPLGPGAAPPFRVRPRGRTLKTPTRAAMPPRAHYRSVAITRRKATSVLIVAIEELSRVRVREPCEAAPGHEGWEARHQSSRARDTPGTPSTYSELPGSAPEYERVPRAMSSILNEK